MGAVNAVNWRRLWLDDQRIWLRAQHADEFVRFLPLVTKEAKASKSLDVETVFKSYARGVITCRDAVVFDFDRRKLSKRMNSFIDHYTAQVDLYRRKDRPENIDTFVDYEHIQWDSTLKRHLRHLRDTSFDLSNIRDSLYRPFTRRHLYFDHLLINSIHRQHYYFPTPESERENIAICESGVGHDVFRASITNCIVELKYANSSNGGTQCFPFYTYNADGTNRRENVTDWALAQFRARYGDAGISKLDIFHYVYGLLHHPGYRERHADSLRRELPRIPLAPDFAAFRDAGKELARLHLNYERERPWQLDWETADGPVDYRVEKMRPLKRVQSEDGDYRIFDALQYNDTLTLRGIPAEAFRYRLGTRSALEWVVDQYRVKTDKRSGIVSDPNAWSDDQQYIVNLVGRVLRVSMETVTIVDDLAGLPLQ